MEVPRHWRTKTHRYHDFGQGKIYSFTNIGPDNQQLIAIIEVEGKRITAQLTDFDHIPQIGESVECVTRKWSVIPVNGDEDRGLITYGYKFKPISSSK